MTAKVIITIYEDLDWNIILFPGSVSPAELHMVSAFSGKRVTWIYYNIIMISYYIIFFSTKYTVGRIRSADPPPSCCARPTVTRQVPYSNPNRDASAVRPVHDNNIITICALRARRMKTILLAIDNIRCV